MYDRMDALKGTQVEAHTDAEHAGAGFMCIESECLRRIHGSAPDVVGFTARISVQQTIINGHSCGSCHQVRMRRLKGAHVGTVLCYLPWAVFVLSLKFRNQNTYRYPTLTNSQPPSLIYSYHFFFLPLLRSKSR